VIWHGLWWGLMALLALLWTGAVSLLRAVIGWDGWQRGGDWAQTLPQLELPPWMVELLGLQWVNWTRELLADWAPQIQAWVAGMPLADWAGLGLNLAWGAGLFLLLLLGGAGSGVIALVRRNRPRLPPSAGFSAPA
jgi:hypothetical protein